MLSGAASTASAPQMYHLCPSAAAGLAQNKYLEDKAFLNYLKYLEYWRQPQYAKYIRLVTAVTVLGCRWIWC